MRIKFKICACSLLIVASSVALAAVSTAITASIVASSAGGALMNSARAIEANNKKSQLLECEKMKTKDEFIDCYKEIIKKKSNNDIINCIILFLFLMLVAGTLAFSLIVIYKYI